MSHWLPCTLENSPSSNYELFGLCNKSPKAPAAQPGGNVNEADWKRGLAALKHFVSARGSARVPARAVARGVPLGKWAATCRAEYWEGELTVSQIAELESLPGWDWSGGAQKRWEAHFA